MAYSEYGVLRVDNEVDGLMTRRENLDKAIRLVDRLSNLADNKRVMLKQLIAGAARGGEEALAGVILFPYSYKDHKIFSEILRLILEK